MHLVIKTFLAPQLKGGEKNRRQVQQEDIIGRLIDQQLSTDCTQITYLLKPLPFTGCDWVL